MWKEIVAHVKQVAIEDFKTFFEPFVWLWRGSRQFISWLARKMKCWFTG